MTKFDRAALKLTEAERLAKLREHPIYKALKEDPFGKGFSCDDDGLKIMSAFDRDGTRFDDDEIRYERRFET